LGDEISVIFYREGKLDGSYSTLITIGTYQQGSKWKISRNGMLVQNIEAFG